jgi:hypothetical protein
MRGGELHCVWKQELGSGFAAGMRVGRDREIASTPLKTSAPCQSRFCFGNLASLSVGALFGRLHHFWWFRFGGLLAVLLAQVCFGQTNTLRVFSEFTRIDPFGQVVPQDRGGTEPRSILSPGVPRNAFSSFRIAVTFDKPAKYVLDIGQNPENAVKATLYRERFEKHGESWIPDGLQQVKIPYEGDFPDVDIPGQSTVTFWLDTWVAKTAPVDRIKVEPQLWVSYANDWFTYPMEVRILDAVLPTVQAKPAALPKVTDRSDSALIGPIRAALCDKPEAPGDTAINGRALIRRNVLQLLAAKKLTLSRTWCSDGIPASGPEWFLKMRDSALRTAAPL